RRMDLAHIAKHAEHTQQPEDHDDDNHHVEDLLDLLIHGNVGVDKPEQYTRHDEGNQDGEQGHYLTPCVTPGGTGASGTTKIWEPLVPEVRVNPSPQSMVPLMPVMPEPP